MARKELPWNKKRKKSPFEKAMEEKKKDKEKDKEEKKKKDSGVGRSRKDKGETFSYKGQKVSEKDYDILTGRKGGKLSEEGKKVMEEKGRMVWGEKEGGKKGFVGEIEGIGDIERRKQTLIENAERFGLDTQAPEFQDILQLDEVASKGGREEVGRQIEEQYGISGEKARQITNIPGLIQFKPLVSKLEGAGLLTNSKKEIEKEFGVSNSEELIKEDPEFEKQYNIELAKIQAEKQVDDKIMEVTMSEIPAEEQEPVKEKAIGVGGGIVAGYFANEAGQIASGILANKGEKVQNMQSSIEALNQMSTTISTGVRDNIMTAESGFKRLNKIEKIIQAREREIKQQAILSYSVRTSEELKDIRTDLWEAHQELEIARREIAKSYVTEPQTPEDRDFLKFYQNLQNVGKK